MQGLVEAQIPSRKRKLKKSFTINDYALEIASRTFSTILSDVNLRTKKRKRVVVFGFSVYGRFLSISTARTATQMTMTIIIAATPSITVLVDAKPVTGEAVGAVVAAGVPA